MTKANRRSIRIPIARVARWLRGDRVLMCEARDLNEHGLFLRTTERTPPNRLMRIELELPGRTVTFLGVARFLGETASGVGIGVEIFSMHPADKQAWLTFYRSMLDRAVRIAPVAVASAG